MPDIQRDALPTQIPIHPATIQRPDAYNYILPLLLIGVVVMLTDIQWKKVNQLFGALGSSFGGHTVPLLVPLSGLASDLFKLPLLVKMPKKQMRS